MLRRKLLIHFGAVVMMFVLTAATVLWLLESVLRDVRHIDTEAWVLVERVNELSTSINVVESDLSALQIGRQKHLDSLIENVDSAQQLLRQIGESYVISGDEPAAIYRQLAQTMPTFERYVGALATAQDAVLARGYTDEALNLAITLRRDTLPLSRLVRGHAREEQEKLITRFRNIVIGLAIGFLLVINLSVVVILHMGSMIVRPVEQLVEATRELGQEHFDYRVRIEQNDEFQQLADAYNNLARDLQVSEGRKMEVLAQVAVTLNHELNNAMAVIQLQLQRIGRDPNATPENLTRLREIEQSLQRMTRTVQSLKNIRRIVLTDYIPGMKMLDLEKSVASAEVDSSVGPHHTHAL